MKHERKLNPFGVCFIFKYSHFSFEINMCRNDDTPLIAPFALD